MPTTDNDLTIDTLETRKFSAYYQQLATRDRGRVTVQSFWRHLHRMGITRKDPRVEKVHAQLQEAAKTKDNGLFELRPALFEEIMKNNALIRKSFERLLIIPEFEAFCGSIAEIFEEASRNKAGKLADYIPQLSRVDPELFAVSICTIDGQRFSLGDVRQPFCLQSSCKPINYCLAMEELGEEEVHRHVGREPSGHTFNELSLNKRNLPHNPMINAGAIMCNALLKRDESLADRYDYVKNTWQRLTGGRPISFSNSVYLSEKQTADRNFALAYFMREKKAFPPGTDLNDTLDFYLQCCSIESCVADTSVAAATLANSGANPLTGDKIFSESTVQHCMSLMLSCGMYDFSGEFAFHVGLPAKSGVSGVILVVVPNVMGIAIYSPRLDALGNSVRGVEFCERLVDRYNFHIYDSLNRSSQKTNPRLRRYESQVNEVVNLIWSASKGDLEEVLRLQSEGVDLGMADYDGRTALHLAASDNQAAVVAYLIDQGINLAPIDRWGNTPIMDARRGGHGEIVMLLENAFRD